MDNRRQRSHNDNDMAQDSESNRGLDGFESTPEFISNPRAHNGSHVAPEGIDCSNKLLRPVLLGG